MCCVAQDRRGVQQELVYMDKSRVLVKYLLPLSEVVIDFNDLVKSLSSGYARCLHTRFISYIVFPWTTVMTSPYKLVIVL